MSVTRKCWLTALLAGVVVLLALLGLLLFRISPNNVPCFTIVTPPKASLSGSREVIVDVTISDLGQAIYPAASASIRFDPARLEFLGVQEGNVFIRDGTGPSLPDWNCNPTVCNETGVIQIMYLDLTGGTHAFDRNLLAPEDNVLLRLAFRLRGSARAGDVYDLTVEDAVFAASNEAESLSVLQGTLTCRNGRIVVGG